MSLSTRLIQFGLLAGVYTYRKPIAQHIDDSWRVKNPSAQQAQEAATHAAQFKHQGIHTTSINHYRFGHLLVAKQKEGFPYFLFSSNALFGKTLAIAHKPDEISVKIRK